MTGSHEVESSNLSRSTNLCHGLAVKGNSKKYKLVQSRHPQSVRHLRSCFPLLFRHGMGVNIQRGSNVGMA